MLHGTGGKSLPAKDVFSIVIAHLKERILCDVRMQNPSAENDDVLYVLTVPAIWSDGAKQFMREAATSSNVSTIDVNVPSAVAEVTLRDDFSVNPSVRLSVWWSLFPSHFFTITPLLLLQLK